MAKYQAPGVYVEDINNFPPAIAQVSTSVAAFVGYTEKAVDDQGASLFNKPQRISSLLEYETYFGGGQNILFRVDKVTSATHANSDDILTINNEQYYVTGDLNKVLYLYNSIRLFFLNGGGDCYILSVGDYETFYQNGMEPDLFAGSANANSALDVLKSVAEPSLIVIPDAVILVTACYTNI